MDNQSEVSGEILKTIITKLDHLREQNIVPRVVVVKNKDVFIKRMLSDISKDTVSKDCDMVGLPKRLLGLIIVEKEQIIEI